MAQPQAGDWEFTLGGSGISDQDFDTGGLFSVRLCRLSA
jgi:hypothetical protein